MSLCYFQSNIGFKWFTKYCTLLSSHTASATSLCLLEYWSNSSEMCTCCAHGQGHICHFTCNNLWIEPDELLPDCQSGYWKFSQCPKVFGNTVALYQSKILLCMDVKHCKVYYNTWWDGAHEYLNKYISLWLTSLHHICCYYYYIL